MSAFLEINEGGKLQRIICGSLVTMGRDVSSTLQVNDPLVSRFHSLIRFVGNDSYYLLDAGSRNGSFLNNHRISTPTLLKSGDVVTLGDTHITFVQETGGDPPIPQQTAVNMGETISHVRLEIQPITILVADIRGYTTMSESLPITSLSKMMTKWFSDVQETIERRRGRVDKFIGDCVMAIWYHNEQVEQDRIHDCLRAAIEIQDLTQKLINDFPDLHEPLSVAAGINTGMAAVGVGSDNTAMGDAVNLAFRLETSCRTYDAEIILSQTTYEHLPEELCSGREKEIKVKGKTQATKICTFQYDDLKPYL